MDPSEKLISAIREKDIRPTPEWRFRLKEVLFTGSFLAAAVLGALAFSIILFAIQQTDFNVLGHLSHSRLELFLGLLPLLWIACLILALTAANYGIRHSKKGYKFTLARRAGYSAALSLLLGTAFFITGGAQWLEHAFAVRVSLYDSIQDKKIRLWSMPEEGQLAGEILKIDPDRFDLRDFNGKNWAVQYDSAWIAPVVLLEKGEKIKLVGVMTGRGRFQAGEIRPWEGPGGRRMRGDR